MLCKENLASLFLFVEKNCLRYEFNIKLSDRLLHLTVAKISVFIYRHLLLVTSSSRNLIIKKKKMTKKYFFSRMNIMVKMNNRLKMFH